MASPSEIARLRQLAKDNCLENASILDKYTDEQLASRVYNGIGPESFPKWLREVIDFLNPSLEPVALIHDAEWYETDRTKASFEASNRRFRSNGIRMAKATYGWWNPLRYRVRRQAKLFSLACGTQAGWKAWLLGDRRRE